MAKPKPTTPGDIYGRLTILRQAERSETQGDNHRRVIAQCECGEVRNIMFSLLITGKTVSCGCYRRTMNITHGLTGTRTYAIYRDMLTRCNNPNYREYHLYGGRGIKVCVRWTESFENFLADMGQPPDERMTLERERVNEGYGPGNCKWATQLEQANNKRNNVFIELNGRRMTIPQWSRETGIKSGTLHFRRRKGWPPERILIP